MIIKKFSLFKENSSEIISGEDVANYVKDITPNEEDIPTYFIKIISKNNFIKERIKIKDILIKDKDVVSYIENSENRYDGVSKNVYLPIVIVNGEVLDGYNRLLTLYNEGDEYITSYINVK